MTVELRKIWFEVLSLEEDSIHDSDSCFEMGGDSCTAMDVVTAALESKFALDALIDIADRCTMLQKVASGPEDADRVNPASVQSCAKMCTVPLDMMEDVYPNTRFRIPLLQKPVRRRSRAFSWISCLSKSDTQDTSSTHAAFEFRHNGNTTLRTHFVEALTQDGCLFHVSSQSIAWPTGNDLLAVTYHPHSFKKLSTGM